LIPTLLKISTGEEMYYKCPVCSELLKRDLEIVIPHTEKHIVDLIKKRHPDWAEDNGVCKRCHEYYKDQLHPKDKK